MCVNGFKAAGITLVNPQVKPSSAATAKRYKDVQFLEQLPYSVPRAYGADLYCLNCCMAPFELCCRPCME